MFEHLKSRVLHTKQQASNGPSSPFNSVGSCNGFFAELWTRLMLFAWWLLMVLFCLLWCVVIRFVLNVFVVVVIVVVCCSFCCILTFFTHRRTYCGVQTGSRLSPQIPWELNVTPFLRGRPNRWHSSCYCMRHSWLAKFGVMRLNRLVFSPWSRDSPKCSERKRKEIRRKTKTTSKGL